MKFSFQRLYQKNRKSQAKIGDNQCLALAKGLPRGKAGESAYGGKIRQKDLWIKMRRKIQTGVAPWSVLGTIL